MAGSDQGEPSSPITWDADGTPRSTRFDDVYHSRAGGLGQARRVFLDGCDLPHAWAGRSAFVVGELGFGTGLNAVALLDLWRRSRPPGGRLTLFSVEAEPPSAADAVRALAPWPEIGELARRLTDAWPRRARGFHRIAFPDIGASIDLACLPVEEALDGWSGAADAWFLDGFAPAKNPAMWSGAVFARLARRSAPGARAATYTVAGAVRRGLQANGFVVERRPGYGGKRERLEARRPGAAASPRRPSVAIVGAGVAGAALARAFAELGLEAQVVEADAPGGGASGNPAALVLPRLDAGGGPIGALHAQALARACDLYDATPGAVIARGALQLEVGPKDSRRFDRVCASALFAPGAVERLSAAEASARAGERLAVGALAVRDGRVVDPAAVLDAWLIGAALIAARVGALEPHADRWRLVDDDGREIARADVVCLANALDAARLASAALAPLRGQASAAQGPPPPAAVMGEAFAIPTAAGLLYGATHDRDDAGADIRPGDDARNLQALAATLPALAARAAAAPAAGRCRARGDA